MTLWQRCQKVSDATPYPCIGENARMPTTKTSHGNSRFGVDGVMTLAEACEHLAVSDDSIRR